MILNLETETCLRRRLAVCGPSGRLWYYSFRHNAYTIIKSCFYFALFLYFGILHLQQQKASSTQAAVGT